MVQCLEEWAVMCTEQRAVVTTFDWGYYEMQPWRESRHQAFPAHIRSQTVAVVMAIRDLLPEAPSRVASLLTRALDAKKRARQFKLDT